MQVPRGRMRREDPHPDPDHPGRDGQPTEPVRAARDRPDPSGDREDPDGRRHPWLTRRNVPAERKCEQEREAAEDDSADRDGPRGVVAPARQGLRAHRHQTPPSARLGDAPMPNGFSTFRRACQT